jgi:hypothetical protein
MTVAATNAYDSERIARLLKGYIEAGLPAKLDLVEARWASEAPLTLPDPVTFYLGFMPDLLELYSASFPIVCVIPAERNPEGAASWGFQKHDALLDIHFFNVADTYDDIFLYTYRYAEAITLLLQDYHFIANHEQKEYKPEVKLGMAGRHPVSGFSDMSTEAGTDYVQGGRVTITLKAG